MIKVTWACYASFKTLTNHKFKKMFRNKIIRTAFVLSISLLTMSGIIRHDQDRQKYIEIGMSPEFDCVGRYSTIKDTTDYAAGVLIAQNWVLTASHFVEDSSLWKFGNKYYKTKRIIKNPKLLPDASELQWNGWDLALIELEKPVMNIKPAIRYRGRNEFGKVITKIGYGYWGDGKSGLKTPRVAGRLGGNNTIDAVGGIYEGRTFTDDVLVCDFDSPETDTLNRFGSSFPLEFEIGGSKGDSGGGVFIYNNGHQELVGIVSGALNRQIKYGSVMALARISSANNWIDSTIVRKTK